LSSLYIPDDTNISIKKDISSSTSSFSTNNTVCKRCGQQVDNFWCPICEAQIFEKDFPNWTSRDKDLDELIRNSQLNAKKHDNYFEWVEYDRFEDVKYLIQGSYCKIYKATWRDGIREKWDYESRQWVRTEPVQIILREFRFESTIKNLKLHLEIKNVICCYGFTLNPETNRYYMILKYANYGNFRQYIWKKFPFRWRKRLSILRKIVEGLSNIHEANYIHRDLYPGNILIHEDWEDNIEIYISELDSCAKLNSEIEQQQYGNLPYIAPEVIRGNGNLTSIKSDIYSIGIIMWELASGDEPYSDYEIDNENKLIRDIINGVRPNDVIGIPECYHELMQKCLDPDPKNRPTTQELLKEIRTFTTAPLDKQFECQQQPHGTRPDQLSKTKVKKTIDVITSSSGTISFRFTNKLLSDYKI
jgi:serine/threonine protein kinase